MANRRKRASGGLGLGLALLALALLPSLAAADCTPGSATLVLAGGAAGGDNDLGQDEWAICLPAFALTVDAKCGIALAPAAAAKLAINGGEALCPRRVAGVDVDGSGLRALEKAVTDLMGEVSFATIKSATLSANRLTLVTQLDNTLEFAVASGSLGDLAPAATVAAACGSDAACAATTCAAGRYRAGVACALCPAGHACSGGGEPPEPCAAGSMRAYAGGGPGSCTLCPPEYYTEAPGFGYCPSCPEPSRAHFPGSTGCLACYFGVPKVVAGVVDGQQGWHPAAPPKPEAPARGYQALTLAGADALGAGACGVPHPFANCSSLAQRGVALEVEDTCLVTAYVLGDASCSNRLKLKTMHGAFRTLTRIESRPEDLSGIDGDNRTVVLQGGASLAIDLAGTASTLEVSAPNATACIGAAVQTTSTAACPAGTTVLPNPSGATVWAAECCSPCGPGIECPATGPDAPCPPGQYNDVIGGTCSVCPGLTVSINPGSAVCSQCGAGLTPVPDKSECMQCPGGTFNTVPGAPCLPCPDGTARDDVGPDTCQPCPPGSIAAPDKKTCVACPPGTFTDSDGQLACQPCAPGTIAVGNGSQSCNRCNPGYIQPQPGQASCLRCGAGKYTSANADEAGPTVCLDCPRGTYKSEAAEDNKCQSCPAGYETLAEAGAANCTACERGYFAGSPLTPFCSPCEAGTYTEEVGQKVCKICPAGWVSTTGGPLAANADGTWGSDNVTASTQCTACPLRTYRPSLFSANTCVVCPEGRETKLAEGASLCGSCAPGTTLLTGAAVNCTECGAGSFTDGPGHFGACDMCPPGSAVADAGNAICDTCPPGTYQDQPGQLRCIDCPVGTYNEMTGAKALSNCRPAPPGNFASGVGNDGFTPCSGGTYQDKAGTGACKNCPPGYECPAGSIRPRACRAGFFADLKQPFCRECPKGTFQDRPAQRACKPCTAGNYCPASKATAPTPCPAGTFNVKTSASQPSSCVKCPINTFSSKLGAVNCSRCSRGQWTGRLTGQTQCWSTSRPLPGPAPSGRRR